nr:hypothetical protein [Tanacetum cinerariifolium]
PRKKSLPPPQAPSKSISSKNTHYTSSSSPNGEVDAVEDLHVDNSISNAENELSENGASNFDDPLFPRPLPKPPNVEYDFEPDSEEEISVVMNDKDDDYFPFMFVIRIFLPYLICFKIFLSFFAAKSEDTIFDPGIFV